MYPQNKTEQVMGELEGSNLNKIESSQPQSLDYVLENESDTDENTITITINHEPNQQQVISPLHDLNAGFERIATEKRLALIKAWEESEKTKVENRAYQRQSAVGLWEESTKASVETQLKKFEENLERMKVEYVLKMKNEIAEIHQYAEEKRAIVEAQKMEEFLELEETAAKFRSSRRVARKKFFACFSC
ncbi:remorin 1.4-like [Trifolium pratense]|uniref:remorin 1.4-like n=1 Tax=Trifolium pratense TaxID=57577 RepID=UPI001E692203|nr:remorin 1.4-like [Trifolium pratense]